eukprot:7389866-Prymnesium_polylepis.1
MNIYKCRYDVHGPHHRRRDCAAACPMCVDEREGREEAHDMKLATYLFALALATTLSSADARTRTARTARAVKPPSSSRRCACFRGTCCIDATSAVSTHAGQRKLAMSMTKASSRCPRPRLLPTRSQRASRSVPWVRCRGAVEPPTRRRGTPTQTDTNTPT